MGSVIGCVEDVIDVEPGSAHLDRASMPHDIKNERIAIKCINSFWALSAHESEP